MDRQSTRTDSFARFHAMLRTRGYSSYEAYLASDAWKQFNIWYRQTNLPQFCLACKSKTFQLHHWTYDNIGQDDPCDVVPLCEEHHHELHRWLKKSGDPLHRVNVHLMKCFGVDPIIAMNLFRPFIRMRSGKKRRSKRCGSCVKRIPLDCVSGKCHECLKRERRAMKAAAAPTLPRTKREKPKPQPREWRCQKCDVLLGVGVETIGNICGSCKATKRLEKESAARARLQEIEDGIRRRAAYRPSELKQKLFSRLKHSQQIGNQ